MGRNRLEAFSDGVLAIVITIMVLELSVPESASWEALGPLAAKFASYALSFLYVGIYWNNHHHILHTVQRVNGAILWANLHLLFWLSLIPFANAWESETGFAREPAVLYGAILLFAAIAYFILQGAIVRSHGRDSILGRAIGRDLKGKASVVAYVVGIGLAFVHPLAAVAVYLGVAVVWLIPDRRIEREIGV